METQSDGYESEQLIEKFLCCVCLDLLYKPVVLACGHASCFWCVHKSMSSLRGSHCPLCRHPYYHFPSICQLLHALLLKMYPVTYKRRENQILEEEEKMGIFSPNFDDFWTSNANEESRNMDVQVESSITSNQDNFPEDPSSTKKKESFENMEQLKYVASVQYDGPTISKQINDESHRASSTVGIDEIDFQPSSNDIVQQILIDDVLCAACKQLLFRAVVLNCGHVYCETCVTPADESIKCQICQCLHPKGFPKVYLELDHFVEEQFPKEYVARRSTVQLKQVQFQHASQPNCSAKDGKKGFFPLPSDDNFLHWCADNGSKVHVGAGCDYCGMCPIVGDRYKCKDCKEAIGFDLCGDCYNTKSKLPGRFNQQHTSEHRFEIVKSSPLYDIILRLLRGQSEIGSSTPILGQDASESPENVLAPLVETDQENAENDVIGPLTPSMAEDQKNDDV